MFGLSFGEIVVLVLLLIVVAGPRQLPEMMRTAGRTVARVRRLLFDMRAQSGIDEILRSEGLEQDIREFRNLVKGDVLQSLATDMRREYDELDRAVTAQAPSGVVPAHTPDTWQDPDEYPQAGCDSYGAVSEDEEIYRPVNCSESNPSIEIRESQNAPESEPKSGEMGQGSSSTRGEGADIESEGSAPDREERTER